jgi:hypothetical protein
VNVAAPPRAPVIGGGKLSPVSLNPSVAQVHAPAAVTGAAENRIETSTYLTKIGETQVLYNGDRMWAKVTLTLKTAGPVAVGQHANLTPVLSGRGQLLQTGVPLVFNVAKGNRLYIAATAVNPVSVVVEAYPWLETITGLAGAASGVVPTAAVAMLSTGKAGR